MIKYSLGLAIFTCLLLNRESLAANDSELYFDTDFMHQADGEQATARTDLNDVLQKDTLGAGRYPVIVQINNQEYGQFQIEFRQRADTLYPLMPTALLHLAGVKNASLTAEMTDSDGVICDDILQSIPEVQSNFDSRTLTLYLSIPQSFLDETARGYVPPSDWDQGINAARLNYQVSAGQSYASDMPDSRTVSAYLNSGLNIAGWRARSSLTFQKNKSWQTHNTYLERDLPDTLGRLMAGELFTQGDVLDSIPFRGVQVGSDVDMIPDAMQGYAPVIRGVANSQAKVEIRQHGYSLYTAFVPPGPFTISDLNTATGSGDLEVLITEANGDVRRFTQPYSTLGNLLRRGTWRYNAAAGRYDAPDATQKPTFLQISGARGLDNDYTATAGAIVAENYRTAQAGLGKGLGKWGAVSVSVNHSSTQLENRSLNGQSYSIRYGKAFNSGTDLRFSGYRYSTQGYRSFSEAINERSQDDMASRSQGRRSRIEANITQNIGDRSSLYMNLSQQDYWGSNTRESQIQAGFNTMLNNVNLGMYISKSLQSSNTRDNGTEVSLTVSLPLGSQNINSTLTRNSRRDYSKNLGISGMAGEHAQMNYSIDASHQQSSSDQLSASGGYRTPWAQLSAGVTQSKEIQSGNIGISGSLLGHSGGIEASQYLGETIALVEVDGTPGVEIQNNPGSPTNQRGFAVVPYLRPYRANRIILDTRNTSNDTVISGGATQLVPRRGAVVKTRFHAVKITQTLVNLQLPDGQYVPFGAMVKDAEGKEITLVGQAGQALISSDAKRLILNVKWGDKRGQSCSTTIETSQNATTDGIRQSDERCLFNDVP